MDIFYKISNKTLKLTNVSYDKLAENLRKTYNDDCYCYNIQDVIDIMRKHKNKFIYLDLSNNMISDNGLPKLVNELLDYKFIEKINFSKNRISDLGLQILKPLLYLPNLKKLHIHKNYGPSDETLLYYTIDGAQINNSILEKLYY